MSEKNFKIVLNLDELHFIDYGHGFASGDWLEHDFPEYYDKITYSLTKKLRKAWCNSKEDKYELILSETELNFIHDLLKDTLIEDFISLQYDPELVSLLEISNGIFKKFGKETLTFEQLEKLYSEKHPDRKP